MADDVMKRSPFNWNFWDPQPPPFIELSCMMPNAIYIQLSANRDLSLRQVKTLLWTEAEKLPLREHLLDSSCYVFQCVTSLATRQEIDDESVRLRDLQPIGGVLRLERSHLGGDRGNFLDDHISRLIGMNVHQFSALNNPEVDDFRAQMATFAQRHTDELAKLDKSSLLLCLHPPRVVRSNELPLWLERKLGNHKKFKVEIDWEDLVNPITLNVAYKTTTRKLIDKVLEKKHNGSGANAFMLKVCGQNEYLARDNFPLIRFAYIQEALARDNKPKLVVVEKQKEVAKLQNVRVVPMTLASYSQISLSERTVPSWEINSNFKCSVLAVCKLNVDVSRLTCGDVEVHVGIYHGGKQLCENIVTTNPDKSSLNKGIVRWNEELVFPITISNIPRMARLCFSVIEVVTLTKGSVNKKKNKLCKNPLAWVNTTIFEYDNRLKENAATMNMWDYPNELTIDGPLHPLGTVAINSNTQQCVTMTVMYGKYSDDLPIAYAPDPDLIMLNLCPDGPDDNLKQRMQHIKMNPFYEMHEQDWNALWSLRLWLPVQAPELLPKLLKCDEWNNQKNVASVNHLVNSWPLLPIECTLELLDYSCVEPSVRTFAVGCLKNLEDDELSLYLLQLTQALKHESYLMCDLVKFLLNRAFRNVKIGHFIFWHLKSEMHDPYVNVRFGLILEAYLRGSQHHIPQLLRQVSCLQKLLDISKIIRNMKDLETARIFLPKYLEEPHCVEVISQFASTLNPSIQCKRIITNKCRVMDSKMRPMRLVFENNDVHGDEISIILKNGDDLRQDMLALQMLRIMDRVWKDEGYDFRLNAYGCIAMGKEVGMIEVVLNAQTIANIQKEKGGGILLDVIRSDSIFSWLCDHNQTQTEIKRAISEFMWSCAGYCVATYILGVGDRHSDNIMVKQCGQLFHIDYGHILGHYKEKFGVRRERVPFVLAGQFVNVINHGKKNSTEFAEFRKLCEEAYLILRRHGMLIVSLFSMMISTGLRELKSEEDLHYLQETLALECTESQAKLHFHSKFDEALRKDWSTTINWLIHNTAKNN